MSEKLISEKWLCEYLDGYDVGALVKGDLGAFTMLNNFRVALMEAPAADAVEVSTIQAWLYEIAGNNINTEKERQFSEFCEELISRLDGLRNFARERSCNGAVWRLDNDDI